jgi:hypothetical protein
MITNRIKRLEKKLNVFKWLPVLFVKSEKEIDQQKHLIGKDTVIIIDDIPEED